MSQLPSSLVLIREDDMPAGNSLQPNLDWSDAAQRFAGGTGRQTFLCVTCVNEGNTAPPVQVVILNGDSLCLNHALNSTPPPIPILHEVPKP